MVDDEGNSANADEPDHASTRIISQSFELEGVIFSWWAVDESPSCVTVSSQWFGTQTEITSSDVEAFAKNLARKILAERKESLGKDDAQP